MPSPNYIVKKGDTLWDISEKYLNSPYDWPRLWRHNNRKDIIAITGQGINDPDLIYPGQKLLLPIVNSEKSNIKAREFIPGDAKKKYTLKEKLKEIRTPIAIKYNLEEMTLPPIVHPNAIVEVKMKGNVVLTSKQSLPVTYVTNNNDIELKMTNEANHAFGSLVSDVGVAYDQNSGKVTITMNLISKSRTPNIPTTAIGITSDSHAPIPKIKYEIKLPELKGNIGNFHYVAANVSVAIEVTPLGNGGTGEKGTVDAREFVNEPSSGINSKLIATGLVAGATLLIIGTLVEYFFTAGAGVADDPASFAGAAIMYARGAALWKGSSVAIQRALLPAMTRVNVVVVPAGTAL